MPSTNRRLLLTVAIPLLVALGLLLVLREGTPLEKVQHVLVAITAAFTVHLLDRLFLYRHVQEEVNGMLVTLGNHFRTKFDESSGELVKRIDSMIVEAERARNTTESALKGANMLFASARSMGLARIYERRPAAVPDILRKLATAEHRVWMAGVTFSESLNIRKLVQAIPRRLLDGDSDAVRILMLHPLCSPAVFRSLLESTPDEARRMIDDASGENPREYFGCEMYQRFERSWRVIVEDSSLHARIRYYAHAPSAWLFIIDDEIFFEPYTFGVGSPGADERKLIIGGQMPVFRFDKKSPGLPFDVLENHFNRTWYTTDVDYYHMAGAREGKERVLSAMFNHRNRWFSVVHNVLHKHSHGHVPVDDRRAPRQPCRSPQPVAITLRWPHGQAQGLILDFARDSARLRLEGSRSGRGDPRPSKGETVSLSWDPPGDPATRRLLNMLAPPGQLFIVVDRPNTSDDEVVVVHT